MKKSGPKKAPVPLPPECIELWSSEGPLVCIELWQFGPVFRFSRMGQPLRLHAKAAAHWAEQAKAQGLTLLAVKA